jgi:signal transduction histidine kinase
VALEVTHQLAEPLRGLRDRLGLVVDHLERFVSTSTGPTPYPWRSLQILRQDVAEAYLEVTQLARRVDELDRAVADDEPHWFDLQATVDLALRLANHHLGPSVSPQGERGSAIELLFDLGTAPPSRGAPGTLALLIAQLVAVSADSARATPGSSLSVRVSSEDAWGVVTVADNGNGSERAAELGELARSIMTPWGGSADAASEPGQGCTFELRLVTQPV